MVKGEERQTACPMFISDSIDVLDCRLAGRAGPGVAIRPLSHQQLHHLQPPLGRRQVERGEAVMVPRVHRKPRVEQQLQL